MASQEGDELPTHDIDVSHPQRQEVSSTQREIDNPPTEGAQSHGPYHETPDVITLPELDPPDFQIPVTPRESRTPRPQRILHRRQHVERWLDHVLEQTELETNQDDAPSDMCNIARRISSDSISDMPLNVPFANRNYPERSEANLPVPEIPTFTPLVMARLGISAPTASQRQTSEGISTNSEQIETIMPPRRTLRTNSRSIPVGEALHVKKKRSVTKLATSSPSVGSHPVPSSTSSKVSTNTFPYVNVTPRAESPSPDIDIRVVLHPTRRRMGPTASETITSATSTATRDLQFEIPVKLEATKSTDTVITLSPRYSITEVIPETQSETSTLLPVSQTASEDTLKKPLLINPYYTPSSSTTSAVPSCSRMRPEPPAPLARDTRTAENEISRIITIRNPRTNEVQEYWVRRNAQMLREVGGSLHDTTASRAVKRETPSTMVVKKMMRIDHQKKKKNLKGIKRIPSKTVDSSSSSTESPRPTARSLSPQQRDAPPAYDPTKYTPQRGPRYERIRTLHMRPKRARPVNDTESSSGYPTWEDLESRPSSTTASELHPIGSGSSTDVDLPEISLEEKVQTYLTNVESQIDDVDDDK